MQHHLKNEKKRGGSWEEERRGLLVIGCEFVLVRGRLCVDSGWMDGGWCFVIYTIFVLRAAASSRS